MATVKQKIAIKKVLNGAPINKSMQEAGYSLSTSKTTGKLTRSKGWAELTEKYISDTSLAKVHKEGLSATMYFNEIIDRDSKGAPVYALKQVPDFSVRHKYLESGYKVKGKYAESSSSKTLVVIIAGQSAERYGVHTAQDTG